MNTDPNYQSDEEILNRLRGHFEESAESDVRPARVVRLNEEIQELLTVLAERIYNQPQRWGLDQIPQPLRDDVALDGLLEFLKPESRFNGRDQVAELFSRYVEDRFRQLWGRSESVVAGDHLRSSSSDKNVDDEASMSATALLDIENGPWKTFEQEFPRDAFALHLRYVLNRSPEDMAVMLDAPTAGAIQSRLSRARGRLHMFFESSRYENAVIDGLKSLFGGERDREVEA